MTPDAKGVLCNAGNRFQKDRHGCGGTCASKTAGLPACLILGAGSSESSGMPLWEAFAGGCLGLLEWTQARRVRGTANVDRLAAVRVQFSLSAGISRRCVLDWLALISVGIP